MQIPKRIIQTWKNPELPPELNGYDTRLRELHPDFEFLFFDDDEVAAFIAREFQDLVPLFEGFEHEIQRYDLFRFLAVLHHGGFYFDIDVWLDLPIHDLLGHEAIFPFEARSSDAVIRNGYGFADLIGQYAFGAVPNHPFLVEIVERLQRSIADPAWAGVPTTIEGAFVRNKYIYYTTGPVLVTRAYLENPAIAERVHLLYPGAPECADSPETWSRFGHYGRRAKFGSWRSRNGKRKAPRAIRPLFAAWQNRFGNRL